MSIGISELLVIGICGLAVLGGVAAAVVIFVARDRER